MSLNAQALQICATKISIPSCSGGSKTDYLDALMRASEANGGGRTGKGDNHLSRAHGCDHPGGHRGHEIGRGHDVDRKDKDPQTTPAPRPEPKACQHDGDAPRFHITIQNNSSGDQGVSRGKDVGGCGNQGAPSFAPESHSCNSRKPAPYSPSRHADLPGRPGRPPNPSGCSGADRNDQHHQFCNDRNPLDANRDGRISINELLQFLNNGLNNGMNGGMNGGSSCQNHRAKRAFERLDLNGDGKLSLSEFMKALCANA